MSKLTSKQQALLNNVIDGARVIREVSTRTTARGNSFSMMRVERYWLRDNHGKKKRLDPRTVESLQRRSLIVVIQEGDADPLRKMVEAMAGNERDRRKARK